jgi:hypothetical protein
LATDNPASNGNGHKMSLRALQPVPGRLRRKFLWRLCALASIALILVACAECSFTPRNSAPQQRQDEPPKLAVGDRLNFIPTAASRAELQGTATIGSWKSQSTDVHGQIVLDTDANTLNALFDQIQSTPSPLQPELHSLHLRSPPIGNISVPVMSLHGDSAGMDRDMQNALNVNQHPSIEYVFERLQQASLQWDTQNHQAELKLCIIGKLNMAGAARPITMNMIVRRDSPGHFLAHAQTDLLMTDFGMTPPGALFGLIKADDPVFVVFDLDLILAPPSPGH